jgi:hypothetical protein
MLKIDRQFQVIKDPVKGEDIYPVPAYIVGSNQLLLYYNGVLCIPGEGNQYIEVGNKNEFSNEIMILIDLPLGSQVTIIVLSIADKNECCTRPGSEPHFYKNFFKYNMKYD